MKAWVPVVVVELGLVKNEFNEDVRFGLVRFGRRYGLASDLVRGRRKQTRDAHEERFPWSGRC